MHVEYSLIYPSDSVRPFFPKLDQADTNFLMGWSYKNDR